MLHHISFSSFRDFLTCPRYFKLVHIDNLKGFEGNIFTAFGKSIHFVCENRIGKDDGDDVWNNTFEFMFLKEIQELPEETKEKITQEDVDSFTNQGFEIIAEVFDGLKDYFGEFEVFSVEEKLLEPIDYFDTETLFKGFIDLVLKTSDGKYHLIDYKTCSWGWDKYKKSDKILGYQLVLYKYFFSKKYNIPLDDIFTHFGLLKRTAKVSKKIELFKVSSGTKKTQGTLDVLKNSIITINKNFFPKNKTKCKYCACKLSCS